MSLFAELKRRNVIRVAVFYLLAAWLLVQVAETVLPAFEVPDGVLRGLVILLVLGLVPTLVVAWVYELTPEGLERESQIDSDRSISRRSGHKLNLAILAVAVLAVGMLVWDRFAPDHPVVSGPEAGPQATSPVTTAGSDGDGRISIAVLPFVNMSADAEQEYFADGLSEELLNVLAQVPDFRVVARTSSFAFKGQNVDLREVGERLGVDQLLEGSVRRAGDRVRITAQLIRARDGIHLWSESYERGVVDVFAIQDDIAANVLRALQVVLDERARQRMHNAGVRDVEAFIAYQKGLALYEQAHGSLPLLPTLARANAQFDLAIARVPDFSTAHYLKADYHSHVLLVPEADEAERAAAPQSVRAILDAAFESSRDPAQRATIDVDRVLFSDDWSTLADRIERVLTEPGCPQDLWIEVAMSLGYAKELVDLYGQRSICDPLSVVPRVQGASARVYAGDAAGALAALAEVTQALGEHSLSLGSAQFALLAFGRYQEATAVGERIAPDDDFFGLTAQVAPLAAAGQLEQALAAQDAWIGQHGEPDFSRALLMLAATGQRERANALAGRLDAAPAGPMLLLVAVNGCACGVPFDLSATPNFARRIAETGRPWPPPTIIRYPAKEW